MSKFVRSSNINSNNGPGNPRLPGVPQQRLYGDQVSVGEPFHLEGNAEFRRDVESSLEIIAHERLMEVEVQAKGLLTRAKEEAGKILEKGNAQAREMLAQAQSEVEGIREAAYEEGFKSGFQEGYTDATAQVTQDTVDMMEGAQLLVEGAYLAEKRVMKHFESRTLELVRHVVRQILHQEITDSPATLMRLIHNAVESLYINGKVQVVVSAQVIHELRSYATATETSMDSMRRFEFIADPILERHQIYIIGQDSCFDLSPEAQAELLLAAIEPHFNLPREIPETVADIEPLEAAAPVIELMAMADEPEPIANPAMAEATEVLMDNGVMTEVPLAAPEAVLEPERVEIIHPEMTEALESSIAPSDEIESPLATASEVDPVAWEEFPTDIQQLGGFPVEEGIADVSTKLTTDTAGIVPPVIKAPKQAEVLPFLELDDKTR